MKYIPKFTTLTEQNIIQNRKHLLYFCHLRHIQKFDCHIINSKI